MRSIVKNAAIEGVGKFLGTILVDAIVLTIAKRKSPSER